MPQTFLLSDAFTNEKTAKLIQIHPIASTMTTTSRTCRSNNYCEYTIFNTATAYTLAMENIFDHI